MAPIIRPEIKKRDYSVIKNQPRYLNREVPAINNRRIKEDELLLNDKNQEDKSIESNNISSSSNSIIKILRKQPPEEKLLSAAERREELFKRKEQNKASFASKRKVKQCLLCKVLYESESNHDCPFKKNDTLEI